MTGTNAQSIAAAVRYFAELRQARAQGAATGARSLRARSSACSTPPARRSSPRSSASANRPVAAPGTSISASSPRPGSTAAARATRRRPNAASSRSSRPRTRLDYSGQRAVSRYRDRYRLVLVINARDFVLVGAGREGRPAKPETPRLADRAADFARRLKKPRAFAGERVRNAFHIQIVNNRHSRMKGFLRGFRGIATRYLDNYLRRLRLIGLTAHASPRARLTAATNTAYILFAN